MKILLEEVYKKVVTFLNEGEFEYIIIGGIAAGVLGEPRLTGDVDVDILLNKEQILDFLNRAKEVGFKVDEERCTKQVMETGTFQLNYGEFHVDFIIASTDLEQGVFKRKKAIRLYNIKAFFPTPEDLILLKLIPGRPQDLLDVERIILRHKERLDRSYLETWAKILSDEAEDMRIWNELHRLLTK